jgi:hypothetical protein
MMARLLLETSLELASLATFVTMVGLWAFGLSAAG